ncbi:helix-turn-helix domain-containing protein [Streptomyces canus]|uniref:helix-turn-helix domain-containing protein n=1 Tax=Streptomyces canus TaxID=58343 RepID=UPI0033B34D74
MRTQRGESVLARAVRIFEAFTPEESALTVSEISRRTGLHVATASRLVAELVSYGFLTRVDGREHLLPYGTMAFNAFGPRNDLVAADAHRVAELSAG